MEYIILTTYLDDGQKLAKLVNEYITQGWRPQGGVAHHDSMYS